MKTTITDIIGKESNSSLIPVTISNPKGRQIPRRLNAVFIEESESDAIILLDKSKSQFCTWHLNLEPGYLVSTDSKKYSVRLVSFTIFPKFPILLLEYLKDEKESSELKQLRNKMRKKYGISCI